MEKTDPDYDEKRQKFIECNQRVENCKKDDCDGCEFDLSLHDFVHFVIYGTRDEP